MGSSFSTSQPTSGLTDADGGKSDKTTYEVHRDIVDLLGHAAGHADSGRWDDTIAETLKAALVAEHHDNPSVILDVARALQRLHLFERAWEIFRNANCKSWMTSGQEWDGQRIANGALVVRSVGQPSGDITRYARLLHHAAQRSPKCIALTDPRFVPVFRRSFPSVDVREEGADTQSALAEAGAIASLETLCTYFAADWAAIKQTYVPLRPDPILASSLRRRYREGHNRPVVGLSWHSANPQKDVPSLGEWSRFIATFPATFVCLQYGDVESDVEYLSAAAGGRLIFDSSLDQMVDIDAFAAQVSAMDAIVTIPNTTAHMGGAVGVPTIVVLDDRFHLSWPKFKAETPWYPSALMIRRRARSWGIVLEEARERLGQHACRTSAAEFAAPRGEGTMVRRIPRAKKHPHRSPFLTAGEATYVPDRQRVLFVTSTTDRGGCERQLMGTAAGLKEQGRKVSILALARPQSGDGVHAEARALGIPLRYSDELPFDLDCEVLNDLAFSLPHDMFNFAPSVRSGILQERPHVVHAWSDYAAVIAGKVAVALNVPRVVLAQRNVPPPMHLREHVLVFRDAYRALAADPRVAMTNNSERNASAYESWLKLPKGTIKVVPNALFPDMIRMPARDKIMQARLGLGIPAEAKVVGCLMRFVEQKDPHLWVRTAHDIARARADAWFVLGGYGVLKAGIVQQIADLGLSHRFTVLDEISDLGPFYGLLDVFLMTSRFEGTPNVLIEAQAASCPIVAIDVGGVRDAVADGLTARVIKSRTAADLAAAVVHVLEHDSWCSSAQAAGLRIVQSRHVAERVIAQTMDIYYPKSSFFRRLLARLR
jgi:glycosyltransferase involved in cell wall biosynthesis